MKIGPLSHNEDYGQARKTGGLTALIRAINDLITNTQGSDGASFGPMPIYTVATVPGASANVRCWIYVSDEAGGASPAFSDGTNWRRVSDRAIVS